MGAVLVKREPASIIIDDADDEEVHDFELDVPVTVKNVFIDGLARTKNELVTNQLERLFDTKSFVELMRESYMAKLKLDRLGIFKSIEVVIDVADSSNPEEYDVYYYVRELGRLTANTGIECDSMEGDAYITAELNNIRGLGESIKAQVSYGKKAFDFSYGTSAYNFSFTKPSVSNSDKKFCINASKLTADMVPSYFRESSHGLGVEGTLPGPVGMHTLGYDCVWRENLLLPSAPFDIREQCGHSLKSSLRHTLLSDGRDDWIFPSKGHFFKHNIEYAGVGGNVKAIKTDIEVQLNQEILSDIVIAASFRAGGLRSLSDTPALINDRYFLGGPLSVRGYAMRGIGQHAEQASLGGELFWASGLHLYTPLPFRPGVGGFGEYFRTHFFVNTGNLANMQNGGIDMKDFMCNPRLSFGFGLMIIMGGRFRMELNYCIPKNERPGDITSKGVQFGLGVNFL